MKTSLPLFTALGFLCTGCADIEWFPDGPSNFSDGDGWNSSDDSG